jgi:FlaA1/EpsC-like NDP-sugar epimerase
MFNNKVLLITGGTGTIGNGVKYFLNTDIKEIRIFSRDEKKQDDMRHQWCSVPTRLHIPSMPWASVEYSDENEPPFRIKLSHL